METEKNGMHNDQGHRLGGPLGRRAAIALTLAAPAAAIAQGSSPEGPLKIIVPYPPGGPADLIVRLVGRIMGERLGQTVVTDNRSGASGVLGLEALVRSRPDGQTLCLTSIGALTLQPYTVARLPYDPAKDVQLISMATSVPQVLAVSRRIQARNVMELVEYGKANPGKLTFGSAGNGGLTHLAGELFGLRAGIELTHVPYRGAAPAVSDLIAGQIDMVTLDLPPVLPAIGQNGVRALAMFSGERSPSLPEVPSMAEAGLPGATSENFYVLVAPNGTPPERVAAVRAALLAALEDATVRKALIDQSVLPVGSTTEAFAEQVRRDREKWSDVVGRLGRERFQ
jgi:tripartite-type tricarboxylate transporter receptor subunit TctC